MPKHTAPEHTAHSSVESLPDSAKPLRYGWTTGCCAAAACIAAVKGLLEQRIPTTVAVELPKGQCPEFSVSHYALHPHHVTAGIIKNAGDDPDVTDGVVVMATACKGKDGSGITFTAGEGVGTVTLPGLPVSVGEAAINPTPRQIIIHNLRRFRASSLRDLQLKISVPGGKRLAAQTWNPRLGIVGGISILGTTGVVVPYSCSAWIHSIHRGIDVAITGQFPLLGAATGRTSEQWLQESGVPDTAIIDMGDFLGAMCKYLQRKPLDCTALVLAMGVGKATKAAQGFQDLRAKRCTVNFADLAMWMPATWPESRHNNIRNARSMSTLLAILSPTEQQTLLQEVALRAHGFVRKLTDQRFPVIVAIVGRNGDCLARSGCPSVPAIGLAYQD